MEDRIALLEKRLAKVEIEMEEATDLLDKAKETLEKISQTTEPLSRLDLQKLEKTVAYLDELVSGDPGRGKIGLDTIVNGSEALGVEPMRVTLKRLATTHDRFVWLAGLFGVTSIGSLIAWVMFFINSAANGGVP